MVVTMIDTFQVPEDQEQEFLTRWNATTAVFARTDGFIETRERRRRTPCTKNVQ